uniref:Uncharacterized protein n=1 Tax=Panagrellus redivivus TaxID=6233 RepID=A0A7E5A1F2_PANRE
MLPCDIIIMAVMTMFFAATVPLAIAHCARKKKPPPPVPPAAPGTPGGGTPGAKSAYKAAVTPSQLKKPTTSGTPSPADGGAGDKHPEQQKKSNKEKPKSKRDKGNSKQGDPQAPAQPSEPPCLGALDKTQEDSHKSKSSKTSGGDKHESEGKDEKKDKKDADKKEEEEKKEPPPIVPEEHVQQLGNLDDFIKDTRTKLNKEIEEMGSVHEHDKKKEDPFDPNRHVIINEKKCKCYTTNNEETKEDDAPDDLI